MNWLRRALLLAVASCAAARSPSLIGVRLPSTHGGVLPLLDPAARFTVVEFFSAHCPCQATHDARLRRLAALYQARGVAFVAADSEASATLARDRYEGTRRRYPYPILVDPRGAAATALRAEYATYCVLLNSSGAVLYRGGIDSDCQQLHPDSTPYLENAITDALAGRAVRAAEAKSLGCSLMRE